MNPTRTTSSIPPAQSQPPPALEREHMVEADIQSRGITDERVIEAFRRVPRELFVPDASVAHAYEDHPLAIGAGQTISQPYVVAAMFEALGLDGSERVLEIGTGSGYSAALLTQLVREVYTVERIERLYSSATDRLRALGYEVRTKLGDGTLGWPEHAPYDAIVVAAAGPSVPEALVEQLAPGGRLVIPVGTDRGQMLMRVHRVPGNGIERESLQEVRFVPLIGAQGHPIPSLESRPESPASHGGLRI